MANYPSLFIVSIRYEKSLEEIDALMNKHMVFLRKHYAAGDFLASGRKLPRTGGIIIAKGIDIHSIDKIMKTDPFFTGKLASFEITEFQASQQAAEIKSWLKR